MMDNLRDFGQHSYVTWTEAELRKERQEMSKCKHYGISHYGTPSNGNQCPLKDGFAPCEMEVFWKKEPDWSKCALNPEAIRTGTAIIKDENESHP